MRFTGMFGGAFLILLIVLNSGSAQAQRLVELNTWHSPSRGDHITSTSPTYTSTATSPQNPDYVFLRTEGYIYAADAPQPAGTVAVWSFWNPHRNDNFLTTDPAWTGVTEQHGYTRYRLEGYVYTAPRGDTIPLRSFWSAQRQDNAASTDPRLSSRLNVTVRDGVLPSFNAGAYVFYRVQGHVYPPDDHQITSQVMTVTAAGAGGGLADGRGCMRAPLEVRANGLYRGRTERRAVRAWENEARRRYGVDYSHSSHAERATSQAICRWNAGWACTLSARACHYSSAVSGIGPTVHFEERR